MQRIYTQFKRYLLIIILVLLLIAFYSFKLNRYLNFATLQQHQEALLDWARLHYVLAASLYVTIFATLIACTVPCATLLTVLGGILFGIPAILYAEFGTTFGGFILFHAVRTAFGARLAKSKTKGWLKRVETGFRKNAFNYLIMLRLVPVFPCWISNIGAGVLNVPQRTFLAATAIGILPATVIYVMLGRGLDVILTDHQAFTTTLLLKPAILFPLIALGLFSLLPIFYKQVKHRRKRR